MPYHLLVARTCTYLGLTVIVIEDGTVGLHSGCYLLDGDVDLMVVLSLSDDLLYLLEATSAFQLGLWTDL
jgi:hypothetical protein